MKTKIVPISKTEKPVEQLSGIKSPIIESISYSDDKEY